MAKTGTITPLAAAEPAYDHFDGEAEADRDEPTSPRSPRKRRANAGQKRASSFSFSDDSPTSSRPSSRGAKAGRARGGQVKPEQKRRRCVGSADQFAYGWQPPPRRERGSRSLGELVEAEDAAAFALISDAPSPAAAAGGGGYAEGGAAPHGRPAAEKSELDLKADAEARAAADSLREEAVEELDLEWDESRRAMLKILQEMCSPRHLSFSRPFLSPSEAAAASPPLLTLLHVRDRVLAGELGDIFAFACAVRHVFASCYLAHGSPLNGGAVARKCERLDLVFEQANLGEPRRTSSSNLGEPRRTSANLGG